MECSQVALLVRERLAEDGLEAVVPVTSGSKGMHVYARLDGKRTSDEVRDYAKEIAEELESSHRSLVVSQMTKARRGGKVFLDWSQNVGAKTTISPYSMRGRDLPTVAAPRTWRGDRGGGRRPARPRAPALRGGAGTGPAVWRLVCRCQRFLGLIAAFSHEWGHSR